MGIVAKNKYSRLHQRDVQFSEMQIYDVKDEEEQIESEQILKCVIKTIDTRQTSLTTSLLWVTIFFGMTFNVCWLYECWKFAKTEMNRCFCKTSATHFMYLHIRFVEYKDLIHICFEKF
jgi:hypothetical protein